MFSGMDVLAVNPVDPSLKIQEQPEIPSSPITDLEEPSLKQEKVVFSAEVDLLPDSQDEQQNSDELILHKDHETAFANSNDRLENSLESTLSLPAVSVAVSPALTAQHKAMDQALSAYPVDRSNAAVDSNSANWNHVGIGVLSGLIVTGIILACTAQMEIFNNLGRMVLLGWEVLCGIIGAVAAKSSKSTKWDIWIGAVKWALVPVWITLFVVLLIYLLVSANGT